MNAKLKRPAGESVVQPDLGTTRLKNGARSRYLSPSLQTACTFKRIMPDIMRPHFCFLTPTVIHSRNFSEHLLCAKHCEGSEDMTGKCRVRTPPLDEREIHTVSKKTNSQSTDCDKARKEMNKMM